MKATPLFGTLAVVILLIIYSSGCTKTIVNDIYDCSQCPDSCQPQPPSPPKPPACTETSAWTGEYAGGTTAGITNYTYVVDSTFISNGIAKMASSPYAYYFTGIRLNIPGCRAWSGDSIRLEARVRNPVAEGAIEQLDVALAVYGEQDSAWVNFIGRSAQQQFTHLGLLNGTEINNVPELIQLFQDWTEVSFEIKNGLVSAYKNGTLLKSYTLPAGKKLGKLKAISVGFKGTGSVDWVKAFNAAGTAKFKEEFNVNKKSSVEWY